MRLAQVLLLSSQAIEPTTARRRRCSFYPVTARVLLFFPSQQLAAVLPLSLYIWRRCSFSAFAPVAAQADERRQRPPGQNMPRPPSTHHPVSQSLLTNIARPCSPTPLHDVRLVSLSRLPEIARSHSSLAPCKPVTIRFSECWKFKNFLLNVENLAKLYSLTSNFLEFNFFSKYIVSRVAFGSYSNSFEFGLHILSLNLKLNPNTPRGPKSLNTAGPLLSTLSSLPFLTARPNRPSPARPLFLSRR